MPSSSVAPTLSIVVVSFNSAAMLERCLAALAPQAAQAGAEILVVRAGWTREIAWERVHDRFTGTKWVDGGADATIPMLRLLGFRAATAPVVGLLEDDCVPRADWCHAALAAHIGPWVAVGGAVEPGPYARAREWAIYLHEYGRFMLPFEAHASADLPGNNVTYKRAALAQSGGPSGGFYDAFVHREWAGQGLALLLSPTLVVENRNLWRMSQLVRMPFHHGRGFAAQRSAGWSWFRRGAFAVMAPGLLVVQLFRLAVLTQRRRRLRARLVACLPALALFGGCWGLGECVGYVAGPGQSLAHWR